MQNSAASDAPLAAYASATDGASHPQAQQAVPPVGNVAAAYDFGYSSDLPRTGDLTGNLPAKFADLDISTR